MKFNLKKFFAAMFATVIIFFGTANAEQPAAEQYRQMFKSGNFYVEFKMKAETMKGKVHTGTIIFAGLNGERMFSERQNKQSAGFFSIGSSGILERLREITINEQLGGINTRLPEYRTISSVLLDKNVPSILYRDGRYYKFYASDLEGKKISAIVLPEDQLNNSDLDPSEEWDYVKSDLSLPDDLAIFYWNDDPMRENFFNVPAPKYNDTSKKKVGNKEFDCDQYVREIKNLAGNLIASEVYDMLYNNKGELVMIQKYLNFDGKENLVHTMEISKITSDVPQKIFKFEKVKVYSVNKGDMNDLLKQRVEVGTIGGEK